MLRAGPNQCSEERAFFGKGPCFSVFTVKLLNLAASSHRGWETRLWWFQRFKVITVELVRNKTDKTGSSLKQHKYGLFTLSLLIHLNVAFAPVQNVK